MNARDTAIAQLWKQVREDCINYRVAACRREGRFYAGAIGPGMYTRAEAIAVAQKTVRWNYSGRVSTRMLDAIADGFADVLGGAA